MNEASETVCSKCKSADVPTVFPHLSKRAPLRAAHLDGPPHSEQEALLRVIGASIVDQQGAEVEDEPPAADTGREWSDAELTELGNMLVRGLSIEEIARLLRRDHREVREKVAEVGRACR